MTRSLESIKRYIRAAHAFGLVWVLDGEALQREIAMRPVRGIRVHPHRAHVESTREYLRGLVNAQ